MTASSSVCDGVNRLAYLLEGSAAADIGDGVVDVLVGRLRLFLEKCRHRHDHAALAIPALRNVVGDPALLNPVQGAVPGQPFNGGDLLADGLADHDAAGALRDTIDVDGAGPALRDSATIFRARQPDIFPDRPEQRRIRLDIDVE